MADKHSQTRILHVTFNMGFGGTEQVIRQLVTNLDPHRFHCEIACIDALLNLANSTLYIATNTRPTLNAGSHARALTPLKTSPDPS